jgi:type II secretion system protein N
MRPLNLSPRVRKILRAAGYGAFYWFALAFFAYLTFPYERLRDRIISEFNAHQTGADAMRLELDSLSSYWISGVEAKGIRLISPPKVEATATEGATAPKPSVLSIESAHARVAMLPLLFASVRLSFGAEAFGGKVSGQTSESDGARRVELELEDLALAKATMLADIVGLPLAGTLGGTMEFVLPEGKLAKADGNVALKIQGLAVGDGKAKIRDTIVFPKVDAGDLSLEGQATSGQLKLNNFSASGPDLEFAADGSVKLRDPMPTSLCTVSARFKFTDRFTGRNDTTRSLFGTPGSSVPGLFDLDPKNKRAKGPDGFYGWRVTGLLSQPQFTPYPTAGGGAGTTTAKARR